jgi:uncharacterized protein YyaL (SSP411 family)
VILLRGPADGLRPWSMALAPKLTARDLLLALPNDQKVPAALAKPEPDRPTAWICSGTACQAPLTELVTVLGSL